MLTPSRRRRNLLPMTPAREVTMAVSKLCQALGDGDAVPFPALNTNRQCFGNKGSLWIIRDHPSTAASIKPEQPDR